MEDTNKSTQYIVTKVGDQMKSKFGGMFRYIFFKGEDGTNYKTCIDNKCRNVGHWNEVIAKFDGKTELRITGLRLKKPVLIDADSMPKIVE